MNRRSWITAVLALMLVGLQYRLWVAEGSVAHNLRLRAEVDKQRAEVDQLHKRNAALDASVRNLKSELDEVEIRARQSLGMVRQGETFYLVVRR